MDQRVSRFHDLMLYFMAISVCLLLVVAWLWERFRPESAKHFPMQGGNSSTISVKKGRAYSERFKEGIATKTQKEVTDYWEDQK
jgi:hypothetical protein